MGAPVRALDRRARTLSRDVPPPLRRAAHDETGDDQRRGRDAAGRSDSAVPAALPRHGGKHGDDGVIEPERRRKRLGSLCHRTGLVAWPSELLREGHLRELLDVGVHPTILEKNPPVACVLELTREEHLLEARDTLVLVGHRSLLPPPDPSK
jgi:hypothetical protein